MRLPAVAGAFYPSSASALRGGISEYLKDAEKAVEAKERVAIVCPHAGYEYSGSAAAYSYAACSNWKRKDITAVIIGPNHTGMGTPVSVSFEDWKTPLGEMKCDVELAQAIVKGSKMAQRDELAHLSEHSCEVQLPFLQMKCPSAKIVCVCMGYQANEFAQDLGKAIFEAKKKTGRDIVVVASSDFTHYEPAAIAKQKDTNAIARLLAMDEAGFENLVEARNLSICGHGPIAAAMRYAKLSGAKKCELLRYTNSGEATGDDSAVVAYASLVMSK